MESKRKYHIIIGSKTYFDMSLPEFREEDKVDTFLDLVKLSDFSRQNQRKFEEHAKTLIIKNDNYHGIVEAAHDRLGALIEDLTTDDAEIYVHNPPRILMKYLENKQKLSLIELDAKSEKYEIKRNVDMFVNQIEDISLHIIGQHLVIKGISKSLWYLTNIKRDKPYVIMLYGNSSLGKTELVREIAKSFFSGKYLEKHLSMFKNNNYSDYFFGNMPNRRSLVFDLMERESNLIFFDELDKCPEYFYSAFYTLFDNSEFKDTTYDVDVSGVVIVLTSNYQTKEEMQERLGLPIFYRIDKFLHFDDFSCDTIYQIVQSEISRRKSEFEDKLTVDEVYAAVSPVILTSGENARTIKYKIQQVIEELLFKDIQRKLDGAK